MDKVIWCDRGWQPVAIGFCPSEKAWHREMRRINLVPPPPFPTSDACCTSIEKTNGEVDGSASLSIVTIAPHFIKSNDAVGIYGLIVHEATHVWQHILHSIKEENPSPEFEAYSMQCIVMELCNAFEKSTGRKFLMGTKVQKTLTKEPQKKRVKAKAAKKPKRDQQLPIENRA